MKLTRIHRLGVVFDLAGSVLCSCVIALLCAPPAYAYVDPSVMTYTIQAVAGVAVALSAVAAVAVRRVRKRMFALLGIDENASKEVEGDVHRVNRQTTVEGCTETPVLTSDTVASSPITTSNAKIPWRRRFVISLLVSTFCLLTFFVAPSFEMLIGSRASLMFTFGDLWPLVTSVAVGCSVCLALLLSVLRGRVFDVGVMIVFSFSLCAYIQAMGMNISLPGTNGGDVDWGNYVGVLVLSTAVWMVIAAICIVSCVKKPRQSRLVAMVLCAVLIIVQTVGVTSLYVSSEPRDAYASYKVTEDGMFSLSPKSNVVFFVLDTVDTNTFLRTQQRFPQMCDSFTDFTFYQNSGGGMIPTRWAIPLLLTGRTPQEGERVDDYINARFRDSTYVEDIRDAGYSIGLYTDTLENGVPFIADDTINIHPSTAGYDVAGTLGVLAQCCLYRELPWAFKPFFRYSTDDVNNEMMQETSGANTPYVLNDPRFYYELSKHRLAADDMGENGAFRLYHLLGSHMAYNMNELAQPVGEWNSTIERQTAGDFHIVSEYLDQLKQMDLYDRTTIIVTADHGAWVGDETTVENKDVTNPVILVKPAKTALSPSEPMRVSLAPVTHTDLLPTVIQAVGGDLSHYSAPIDEVPEADRLRYFYWAKSPDGLKDAVLQEFEIDGDARIYGDWRKTGREWDCTS